MLQVKWWLMGGTVLFLVGGAMAFVAFEQQAPQLARGGAIAVGGAAVCFGFGAWQAARRVDWRRIEEEQELWESGPLGRSWLKIRKKQ